MALRGLTRLLPSGARSASSVAKAVEAVKTQVSSAAKAVGLDDKLPTLEKVEGKHGAGVVGFVKGAVGAESTAAAAKQYARAVLDGNLAEVALYGQGAQYVGTDSAGNRYYERRDAYNVRARMVVYADIASGKLQNYDASSIQGDGWYSWVHHTTDTPPTERSIQQPVYYKPREVTWMGQPKVAEGRFWPKGSWYEGEDRRKWGKIAAWKPPGPHGDEAVEAGSDAQRKSFAGT